MLLESQMKSDFSGLTAKRVYASALFYNNEIDSQWLQHMVNTFANNDTYISTKWLLQLLAGHGLHVEQLLRIIHLSGGQPHYLALLGDGRYVCDCCMGINLGIPCRHYFQALTTVPGLRFSVALVRSR
jgi:hypothetical protein